MESETGAGGTHTPPSTRRARLVIKEMVLRNFKSYAGEQRIGPFHKSFSAVVGPNGSGKSNVIDAMLFVFGKRAKQMRLNKVSELIHNSSNHQNLESAGVSVHFQEIIDVDDGTYEAVAGSDFVITRVAFRDNASKYYINDRGSSFTEVTKKLKGKGVDLDNNRFLILQGEVEQISLMKPKAQGPHDEGFLEYLEDIIGTNQYVEKIEETFKQLEALNDKRSAAIQMVKLAEKEKDSLEDVKNEAEAYMLKELSLLKWQEKATKLAFDDTSSHISELQEKLSNLEENHATEREKIQQNLKMLKELESVYDKYVKRQEELDTDMRSCKEQFKEFERQDVKHQEDLKHKKQKIKKLEDKLGKDTAKIDELASQHERLSDLIPKLEEEVPKLQHTLQEEEMTLEKIKETSRGETEMYRSELMEVRAELEPWENQLIEHRGSLDVASAESKLLREKHDAGRKAFEDAKHQIDEIVENIKIKNEFIAEVKNKLVQKKLEKSEARKLEQECIKEQESLICLEQAARQKLTEMKSTLESEKSHGSVLKAILQAKETKEIEGIYGRLGDLGSIDAKYDIAISTACPGLDYIVVETTAVAQACVELLRRKNLGIATFMILERQLDQLRKLKDKVKTPEGVPRLFDLVAVKDEKLKLAFFASLGNTVVAKDLDQSSFFLDSTKMPKLHSHLQQTVDPLMRNMETVIRIAYGGDKEFRRVVTLEGALFEKSGTMSGGGNKPRGGKMGTYIRESVSGEDVASCEKDLTQLVDQLSDIRHKIADCTRRFQACEKDETHYEMELAKTQKEIDSLNEQHNYIKSQLAALKAASQPKKEELNRLKELDGIISAEQSEIEKLVKSSSTLKERASELQKKIENVGGELLKNQKSKVAKIQEDIDKTCSDINRHKVNIASGQKMTEKLKKGIEDTKKEKEKLVQEKGNMLNVFKEIEQKAFVVQENYKKTQELIDKHKVVLEETKNEYNKLKKTMDELRAAEVDAEFKMQDAKKLKKEWEMKAKALGKKLDDIQSELVKQMDLMKSDALDAEKVQAILSDEALQNPCDTRRAMEMVTLLEAQLKDMNPNLDSIAEYHKKVLVYNERVEELNVAKQECDELKKHYDELKKRRLDEFMAGFNLISLKLKEMYQMITLGGDAELELVDSLDPFSEGVVFSVRPPKKSWKNIANLSGGEKTLSSLALVFALHHYKPTPLYVMDEIDAALDFKNVSIVGHYVKDRTKDAQFIIISLRNNMFELADRLVGIYKTDNCTKSITINPESFVNCGNAA